MTQELFFGIWGDGNGSTSVDGSINLINNKMPWIKGSDKLELDINANDTETFQIAKKDMPDWKTKLVIGKTSIVVVNTDASIAWNSPDKVKFFGVLTKINPKHKDNITIKADGLFSYLNHQALNDMYGTSTVKPSEGKTITGGSHQAVMANMVLSTLNPASAPAGQRPANVLAPYYGPTTGTTYSYKVKYSDFKSCGAALVEYRDMISTNGNEFRFIPRMESASMNRVVCDMVIGTDDINGAHINESQTVTIQIDSPQAYSKMVEMSTVYDLNGVSTRIIAQSKAGDETADTGSDLQTKINTNSGLPRYDTFFNPGVELTPEEMSAQLTSRIAGSVTFAEATYSVEEDFNTVWANHIGKTIVFTGTPGTEYAGFNITVRCISTSSSCSNGSVTVGLMVKQPRYPVLPKDRQRGGGDKDNLSNQPISKPGKPNKPKDPVFNTFPTDDWDKPKIGDDEAPPINITWNTVSGSTFRPYLINKMWGDVYSNVGEGHTLVPDDANGRYISLSDAHVSTMWRGKADGRGTGPDLNVKKTKKFVNRPTGIIDYNINDYNYTDAQFGLTGQGGPVATLTWADIAPHILSGSVDGKDVLYEVFNFGLYIYGPVANRKVVIFGHQLQLLSGAGAGKLRSKNMAWETVVNANYEAQTPFTYVDNHIFSGNAGYDGSLSFYAYGTQIGSDTSGNIENTVVLTPRGYPTDVDIPEVPSVINRDYWANLNMGQYAIYNLALTKEWNSGKLHSSIGPSTPGEKYEDVNYFPIPGVDWSVKTYNTFTCDVVGDYVYATSVTGFGKVTGSASQQGYSSGSYSERLITRAQLTFKPSSGVGAWEQLFSGNQFTGFAGFNGKNYPRLLNFWQTLKRTSDQIVFNLLGKKTNDVNNPYPEIAVVAKNGVKAVRQIKDLGASTNNLLKNQGSWQKYTYGNGYESQEAFSDFMNFSVATDSNGNYQTLWVYASGLPWARFIWGGTVSNYNQTYSQATVPPRSLNCSNFSVNISLSFSTFANGGGEYPQIAWIWEV